MSKSIMLISFHNQKALGVRYLEKALKASGYTVNIVFFKGFNSVKPNGATSKELDLLNDLIEKNKPDVVGLSVMTSLYLETVYSVNKLLKENFNIPIIWGGVYASLFPEKCLEYADYVIRGEGEKSFVELIDAILDNKPFEHIENISFKSDSSVVINDVRTLCQDLDEYGYPEIGGNNKYFINNDVLSEGDPQLNSLSYELTASRGCPFVCSYCCSVNLHRLYKGKGKYVRFRSVASVMSELLEAKAKIKKLKVIHFWDEIFSDDKHWVDEFVSRYKSEINLPFEIWGHPLKINQNLVQKLVEAGLYKVVVGIQSGSPRVRKEIFHRVEKQDEIINASEVLSKCKVPQVIYDFMLQHPFETDNDIKQTYELCMKLKPPFELQLHGLNFLPGTDIVDMAVKMNILDEKELNKIMYSSMQEQYDYYWGYKNSNIMSNFWYSLTFMTQFRLIRPITRYFANRSTSVFHIKAALKLYKLLQPLTKVNYFYKKAGILLRSFK